MLLPNGKMWTKGYPIMHKGICESMTLYKKKSPYGAFPQNVELLVTSWCTKLCCQQSVLVSWSKAPQCTVLAGMSCVNEMLGGHWDRTKDTLWDIMGDSGSFSGMGCGVTGCPIAPLSAIQSNIKHTMCWCKETTPSQETDSQHQRNG